MSTKSQSPAPLLKLTELQGRGRSLIAAAPIKAGEIILRDSPLLLYSALPFFPTSEPQHQHNNNNVYCSNCFRSIKSQPSPPCKSCSTVFCSAACESAAASSSHSAWACQALRRLQDSSTSPLAGKNGDLQIQARFLVVAYNLAAIYPSDFRTLMSLHGDPSSISRDDAVFLHNVISNLSPVNVPEFGVSIELTAFLLAKDNLNGFGIMEPYDPNRDGAVVRAYGIYPRASFFNHDCLPNACRFDYVDSDLNPQTNTDLVVRVLHDVPEGREICLSYFPVNLKYSERQRILKEEYGFECDCDRCKVEANWDEDEGGEMSGDEIEMSEGEEAMDEDENRETEADDGEFPHEYFFLRFVCARENCFGTLAPLPPSNGSPSPLMECCVCGKVSNVDELMDGSGDQ